MTFDFFLHTLLVCVVYDTSALQLFVGTTFCIYNSVTFPDSGL